LLKMHWTEAVLQDIEGKKKGLSTNIVHKRGGCRN
jgi:hypothetical protein